MHSSHLIAPHTHHLTSSPPRGRFVRASVIRCLLAAGGCTLPSGAPPTEPNGKDTARATQIDPSEGCLGPERLADGEHTFELRGDIRRFVLRLPPEAKSSHPWPVVLALHANGGDASYWDGHELEYRNLRKLMGGQAILVMAEAIGGQWRDYQAPPETWPARLETELMYADQVLQQVRRGLCIDNKAVFAMGFSGGGSFAGVLGCRRDDIRAIAAGGAVTYFEPSDCIGTPAAWLTLGELERTPARDDFVQYHRERASCTEVAHPVEPAPCVAYEGCDKETPVHYCEQPDWGHVWPLFGDDGMWTFFDSFVSHDGFDR